jgi:hypothetical protein
MEEPMNKKNFWILLGTLLFMISCQSPLLETTYVEFPEVTNQVIEKVFGTKMLTWAHEHVVFIETETAYYASGEGRIYISWATQAIEKERTFHAYLCHEITHRYQQIHLFRSMFAPHSPKDYEIPNELTRQLGLEAEASLVAKYCLFERLLLNGGCLGEEAKQTMNSYKEYMKAFMDITLD